MAATRTGWPLVIGVARLVRARQRAPCTVTSPSGEISVVAIPSKPINHSRPIVGVANRVRTIDGIPTMKANAIEAIITRLRRKLGPDAIRTRRGFGYSVGALA